MSTSASASVSSSMSAGGISNTTTSSSASRSAAMAKQASNEGRLKLGTLVCVVLKAKNLPNKRSIGKQDPYCVLHINAEEQRTKPDKRGGQHPHWDEQLHFDIYEDMEDALKRGLAEEDPQDGGTIKPKALTASRAGGAKDAKKPAGKSMRVACYADDTREPELIGEGVVDLTETLKVGEFDEWVPIKAKERYAGEVFLELTFYSAAAPPKKKKVAKPIVSGSDTYGGAGTFTEDLDDTDFGPRPTSAHPPIPSSMKAGGGHSSHPSRHSNQSGMRNSVSMSHGLSAGNSSSVLSSSNPLTKNDLPGSLRPSSGLAQIDAYTPPYAPASVGRSASTAPSEVEFERHRRASFNGQAGQASSLYSHGSHQSQSSISTYHPSESSSSMYGGGHQQMPSSASMATIRAPGGGWGGGGNGNGNDSIDELTRPMSSMSMNKPLPPPGGVDPYAQQHPSSIYSQPPPPLTSQASYLSQTGQPAYPFPPPGPPQAGYQQQYSVPPPPLHHQSQSQQPTSYTPPSNHSHLPSPAPTPPVHPNSAPPGNYYAPPPAPGPPSNQYESHNLAPQHPYNHEPPRSSSPAPRPHSAASYHALPSIPQPNGPPTPTASVINAQAYYQPTSSSISQAPPGRSSSPGPSLSHSSSVSSFSQQIPGAFPPHQQHQQQQQGPPPPQSNFYQQPPSSFYQNTRPLPPPQPQQQQQYSNPLPPSNYDPNVNNQQQQFNQAPPPPPNGNQTYQDSYYSQTSSFQPPYEPQYSLPGGYAQPQQHHPQDQNQYSHPPYQPPQQHSQPPPPPSQQQGYYAPYLQQ